jgi:uncharacterized protein (DUF433 family)
MHRAAWLRLPSSVAPVTEQLRLLLSGGRVFSESLVYQFLQGESPEAIAQAFPSLSLVRVYVGLTFDLALRAEIDAYPKQERPGFGGWPEPHVKRIRSRQAGPPPGTHRLLEAVRPRLRADEEPNAKIVAGLLRHGPSKRISRIAKRRQFQAGSFWVEGHAPIWPETASLTADTPPAGANRRYASFKRSTQYAPQTACRPSAAWAMARIS